MKAIVVEDSRLAREGLVKQLGEYRDIELVGSADHPESAQQILAQNPVDIIFLDIHMPGSSGFDLLESLNYSPLVVFTTAYSEHAIRSFDFNTVDYLLKPISRERLDQAIDKLRIHFSSMSSSIVEPLQTQTTESESIAETEIGVDLSQVLDIHSRMFIRDNDKCHLVSLDSIRYFENCKNYARLYFDDNNAFIKKSLNHLEKRLPEKYFFRVNRQFIVNLRAIKAIDESIGDGYCLTLSDGVEIEVSRRRFSRLKQLLSF